MANKINFITGKTYSLSELFSGERRIIIPDLQRDYCWGNKEHTSEKKELVTDFVNNIISQYNKSKENFQKESNLNLGLIYGYEVPANHIQLCDGQQRITTLFLLLGMLNKYSGSNQFRQHLISDFEYNQDDKEPYLQYSVRESSLYFLSDLVCHFFIHKTDDNQYIETAEKINKPENSWYFNDYNFDPSIQSMHKALSSIEVILKNKESDWITKFGDFLVNNLTFMYYDMGNRKNGEETFVIINTTGEPLSATQNLKPRIINAEINKDYKSEDGKSLASKWEEIETWFWSKRENGHDTADVGFQEFLRWVTILHYANKEENKETINFILKDGIYSFPIENISFNKIEAYWESVKFIFDTWENKGVFDTNFLSPKDSVISQVNSFRLLPIIEYCHTHKVKDNKDRNLLRMYHFFSNLAKIDNVSKAANDLVYDAIKIARDNEDIVCVLDKINTNDKYVSSTILTKEEKCKLDILFKNNSDREKIEEAFWETQEHKIWNREIWPLIKWSTKDECFNFNLFAKYQKCFEELFIGKESDSNIDITRRALLTRNIRNYPRQFRGKTNYSFGWEWKDWKVLINNNLNEFKEFLDDLVFNKKDQQKMIDDFTNQDNKYYHFIKENKLINYCKEKNIQLNEIEGILLIKKVRATTYMSVNNMLLSFFLIKELKNFTSWQVDIYDSKSISRVIVKNKFLDIVFNIWYLNKIWEIDFFKRSGDEVKSNLKKYIAESEVSWTYNNRYHTTIEFDKDFSNVSSFLKKIIDIIEKS